jgi:hypothetical protein
MANEENEKNEKRREDLQTYLDELLSNFFRYHNHKENMAHLALAAQVTLTCAFFSGKLATSHCNLHQHFVLCDVFVLLLSIALYLYAGWEMWLRRVAATMNSAIMMTRNKLIDEGFSYTPMKDKVQIKKGAGNFYKWVWFPWFCISDYDWNERGFPNELMAEIKKVLENIEKQDKHLDHLEVGTWILSIIIIILITLNI